MCFRALGTTATLPLADAVVIWIGNGWVGLGEEARGNESWAEPVWTLEGVWRGAGGLGGLAVCWVGLVLNVECYSTFRI